MNRGGAGFSIEEDFAFGELGDLAALADDEGSRGGGVGVCGECVAADGEGDGLFAGGVGRELDGGFDEADGGGCADDGGLDGTAALSEGCGGLGGGGFDDDGGVGGGDGGDFGGA